MKPRDFWRIPDWRALISGRFGTASKQRISSVRFPGTKVLTTFLPISGAASSAS